MKRLCNSWAAVALLAAAPFLAACAQEQPDHEARVNETLETANLGDVDADWRETDSQLVLSGEVQNAADRARAEELARQVVGTTGRVVNEVKVAGTGMETVDDRIEEQLGRMFREDEQWDLDGLDLNFEVEAGVVTITGDAPSQAVKDRVTERVKTVEGVRDVVNNLEVRK